MKYRLLILCATLIWGSTFVLMKDLTDFMAPSWILAIRFSSAAVILALVFIKKRRLFFDRRHLICGTLCGCALFIAYYLQTLGITDTTPGKNAFLTSVYCVIVPFMAWLSTRKAPNRFNLIAALLCIIGIGLICLQNGLSLGFGDGMTLLCAVFFALHITLVAKFSRGLDIYVITIWQFATVALGSWVLALCFEPSPSWESIPWDGWASLAYLTIFATTIALLLQNMGQKHLPAASASLLLSTEAVFGVAFSIIAGAESLDLPIVCGFILVFAAILISEALPELLKKPSSL